MYCSCILGVWFDIFHALAHPVQCSYNCPVLIVVFLSLLLFSLEKVLKSDDKFIDTKKALLKKREEDIVKEAKAAADKKVLSFIIIFYSVIMWEYSLL